MTETPFHTNNALLAFSLYIAGVPFGDPRCPLTNTYTVEMLRGLGLSGKGIEEATQTAFDSGQRGKIEYGFEQTQLLGELLTAFQDQQKQIKESEESCAEMAAGIFGRLERNEISQSEAMARLSCVILEARTLWNELWKQFPPLLNIPNPGQPIDLRKDGVGKVRFPGFKIISLNASEETRKRLKL